tara:strand:- start:228 stop:491 length:264 start_codon:yes stop_codon:yes gene_type:complete
MSNHKLPELPSNKELCEQHNLTKEELRLTRLNKGYLVKVIQGSEENIKKYPKLNLKKGELNHIEFLDSNNKPIYLGLPLVKKGDNDV